MSAPVRDFHKLSIGGRMPPTTRSQTQHRTETETRRGATGPRTPAAAGSSVWQAVSPPDTPVQGYSGLSYDIQSLSPHSTEAALKGLTSEFTVENDTKTWGTGKNSYHAISLKKPVTVRIYNPLSGTRKVKCSCQEDENDVSICEHIYWLYDVLNLELAGESTSSTLTVTKDNVVRQLCDLYNTIGQHIDTLPQMLNQSRNEEALSDSDESDVDAYLPPADVNERKSVIRDMLSIYNPTGLSSEFVQSLRNSAGRSMTSQDWFVPNNLAATLFSLAFHDNVIYERLRRAMTKDFCATKTFEKLGSAARETFERLDRAIHEGPSSNDVQGCASRLRQIVNEVHRNRNSRAPLSRTATTTAVRVLVQILAEVCRRNTDIFEDAVQPSNASEIEGDDRNLYINLIGNPPNWEEEPEPWETDLFVIDVLDSFPPGYWKELLEPLATILEKLRSFDAPEIYTDKLQEMLDRPSDEHQFEHHDSDSGSDEPSLATTRRRPTMPTERESQRPRLR